MQNKRRKNNIYLIDFFFIDQNKMCEQNLPTGNLSWKM